MNAAILIGVMAPVTMLLRFLPFWVFQKETPPYIAYLGRVLPSAMVGMLVIYCLKDVRLSSAPHGLPELIACACVAVLQIWKRNSLLSILAGTIVYMVFIQMVFP